MTRHTFRLATVVELAAVAMALADAPLQVVCIPLVGVALLLILEAVTGLTSRPRR